MADEVVERGLEDVIAASSRITFVDGKEGRLVYEGYDIRDLAEHSTFEEVAYLLWYHRLPTATQLQDLRQRLAGLRELPAGLSEILQKLPPNANPMDALRTAVSALAMLEPAETKPGPSSIGGALRLTAVLPTIVADVQRRRMGLPPLPVRTDLSHAAHILYLLTGSPATELGVRAMDVALVLHADHELAASTFSARVTASTLSDLYSAITSAIGTLKGPLHGGANERVMELLRAVGAEDRVESVVRERLARHERIHGFGHRVYKVEDPRATILRQWSEKVGEAYQNLHWYRLLRRLEEVVHREKGLYPNVDLYSGSVYTLLGIPDDLFTPLFAMSRVAGWTSHVLEEYEDLRLIRPKSQYVGPDHLAYVPIAERTGSPPALGSPPAPRS
jgi:citrate synthase